MNLSKENMRRISDLVESGSAISLDDIKDLLGHNEHLTLLLESRGRLMLGVEIERDQLKAENEALRDGANFRAIQSLRQDCESLRKDAERYRFLRRDISNHSVDFCIVKKFWDRSLHDIILEAESADAQIDAAMSKEG